MHETMRADDFSAEGSADRLMSETDAESGNRRSQLANEFDGDTRFVRSTRTRRDNDPFRLQSACFVQGDLVVASNQHVRAELTQILDKVISEGIVVVEDEDHFY